MTVKKHKKPYLEAYLEIALIDECDVIVTSDIGGTGDGDGLWDENLPPSGWT